MTDLNRRHTLALIAGGAAAGACATPKTETETAPAPEARVFLHGVASGDPMTDSVVLWTRVTTDAETETVVWELAEDETFSAVIASGEAEARADADHTVKAIPTGLNPGATYYYRFALGEETSPTGRTKTLPAGALDTLGVALASCSNYAFGFFNAYDAIAKDEAIDIVLHTGDYIYEYGAYEWGGETASVIGRTHDPRHEIKTLEDYRLRHAQYKTDAGSQAMHAAHPMISCWDDHESANNPWTGGAQNHQPDTEGDWAIRRAASIQAYYEWMPIREPKPGFSRMEYWRTYSFGDLATLITIETRHTARGEQVDYGEYYDTIKTPEDRDAFMAEVIGDPDRKMLSPKMEDALRAGLSASKEKAQSWRVIGNPMPLAKTLVPDVKAMGVDLDNAPENELPGKGPNLVWKGEWNLPFYTDTWDGYPVAREAFYDLCRSVGANDLLVLTGDSHSFWANSLFDDEGRPVGLEIGTAGISSPGDFVDTGWKNDEAEKIDRLFEQGVEEVRWTDNMHQGYVRVVLGRDEAKIDYIAMDTVLTPTYRPFILRSETIIRDVDTLIYKDA